MKSSFAEITGKTVVTDRRDDFPRTLSHWRSWLPPAAASLILILIFIDPFIGDWDAFEYTLHALRGDPSSMALGRSLFIFFNHSLYVSAHAIFGLKPQQAYLLFKSSVIVQAVLSVVACWRLTLDLSHSTSAALLTAWLVAFSPVFVLYSGQVMTDVPAMLLLTLALIVHLRGLQTRRVWMIMFGAALLGLGVNLRETMGFYLPWLVLAPFTCKWRWQRRTLSVIAFSAGIFFLCALSIFAFWFLVHPDYRAAWFGWRESMRVESALHPVSFQSIWPWLGFFFATSPLIFLSLIPAVVSEWRARKFSPTFLLALVGTFANLLLILNYSTSIGWRYFLTGLPALAPVTSRFLVDVNSLWLGTARRAAQILVAATIAISLVLGIFLWPLRKEHSRVRSAAKTYDRELENLPTDAVMISGAQTIAVNYWHALGEGNWETIATGAGWPGAQLPSVIDNYLAQGRRVFVDADRRWWQPCGWHVAEIRQLVMLRSEFHFRRITPTIYEIQPRTSTDNDDPGLEKLLPENRPREAEKCFPT